MENAYIEKTIWITRNTNKLLMLGGLSMLVAPALFTLPALTSRFDFSASGQIGDTIGGITAPIINFVGALLVYLAFKEQQSANKFQFNSLKKEKEERTQDLIFDTALAELNWIADKYDQISFEGVQGPEVINLVWKTISASSTTINFPTQRIILFYSQLIGLKGLLIGQYDLINRVKDKAQRDLLLNKYKWIYRFKMREYRIAVLSERNEIFANQVCASQKITKEELKAHLDLDKDMKENIGVGYSE